MASADVERVQKEIAEDFNREYGTGAVKYYEPTQRKPQKTKSKKPSLQQSTRNAEFIAETVLIAYEILEKQNKPLTPTYIGYWLFKNADEFFLYPGVIKYALAKLRSNKRIKSSD